MSEPFTRLLSELRRTAPALRGEAREDWGARAPGSRVSIRRAIAANIDSLSPADLKMIDDLEEPPRPTTWSVSVAHTHSLGGWMAMPRPAQVGWDVELKSRIKLSTIERVCTREEIAAAPTASYLWCAKEAYFKALEDEQPIAIPQLTITGWRAAGSDLWRWRGIGPRNGDGLLLEAADWLIAGLVIP